MMKNLRVTLKVLAILALMCSPVWATAWTADATTPGVLYLVPADATTSYSATTSMYISSIMFVPTAANDVMVIRNAAAGGPVIAYFKSIDGGPQIIYFSGDRVFRPYILYTDNTLSGTATTAKVIINYGRQP